MRPHGVDVELAVSLTELLTLELQKFEGVHVVGESDLKAELQQEAKKQLAGTSDDDIDAAMAGFAQMLDQPVLGYGTVSMVGNTMSLTFNLLDRDSKKSLARVSQTLSGDPDRLVAAIQATAFNIVGAARGELGGSAISDSRQVRFVGNTKFTYAPISDNFLSLRRGYSSPVVPRTKHRRTQ